MHHRATITDGKADGRPFNIACACGTGGDFGSKEQAQQFMGTHFSALGGINTYEFVDATAKPEEEDAT